VRIASVSKLFTVWATMIAVEEGTTALDEPIGQDGCTVRHLLAHAGGYSFDGINPITSPARKRIYSNTGIELLATQVGDSAGLDFADYLRQAVCEPLGLNNTVLEGSAAKDVVSNLHDCARFVAELRRPTLLAHETVREMTTASDASIRARGASERRFAARRHPTGLLRRVQRRRGGTSVAPERSCGSTPWQTWPA
jgi:CubicO group peptidase (beta-lactamase class C family)